MRSASASSASNTAVSPRFANGCGSASVSPTTDSVCESGDCSLVCGIFPAYAARAPYAFASTSRSAENLCSGQTDTSKIVCNSPPLKTSNACSAACCGVKPNWLKMMSAITPLRPTALADGPSDARTPTNNPHTAVMTMLSTAWPPLMLPTNADTPVAAAVNSIAAARVRYTPWRDAKPTTSAPIAADTPESG